MALAVASLVAGTSSNLITSALQAGADFDSNAKNLQSTKLTIEGNKQINRETIFGNYLLNAQNYQNSLNLLRAGPKATADALRELGASSDFANSTAAGLSYSVGGVTQRFVSNAPSSGFYSGRARNVVGPYSSSILTDETMSSAGSVRMTGFVNPAFSQGSLSSRHTSNRNTQSLDSLSWDYGTYGSNYTHSAPPSYRSESSFLSHYTNTTASYSPYYLNNRRGSITSSTSSLSNNSLPLWAQWGKK